MPPGQSFERVNSFDHILGRARESINDDVRYLLNFDLRVEFDEALLRTAQLLDAAHLAQRYQSVDRPPELYFSHAEFYGGSAIEYLKAELQRKPDSNRAVLSLLSSKDIIGKDDEPIPSFLIMQFALTDDCLYVTAYFRALEVTNFLPVNLEEVRLIASSLRRTLSFSKVRLTIFAFRAYSDPASGVLVRPALDIEAEKSWKIARLMEPPVTTMIDMLRQKQTNTTAVDVRPFETILEIIAAPLVNTAVAYRQPRAASLIKACVAAGSHLKERRRTSSHSQDLKLVATSYAKAIGELIEYLEQFKGETGT